jgi:hypothetical protein
MLDALILIGCFVAGYLLLGWISRKTGIQLG